MAIAAAMTTAMVAAVTAAVARVGVAQVVATRVVAGLGDVPGLSHVGAPSAPLRCARTFRTN